jgi:hypothetical protein
MKEDDTKERRTESQQNEVEFEVQLNTTLFIGRSAISALANGK